MDPISDAMTEFYAMNLAIQTCHRDHFSASRIDEAGKHALV
jgi:hypothetical protein